MNAHIVFSSLHETSSLVPKRGDHSAKHDWKKPKKNKSKNKKTNKQTNKKKQQKTTTTKKKTKKKNNNKKQQQQKKKKKQEKEYTPQSQTPGGLKHFYCRQIFTVGPDVILKARNIFEFQVSRPYLHFARP